jgi:hypothetical protein
MVAVAKEYISNRVRACVAGAAILAGCLGASSARAETLDDMISPVSNPVNFEDPRIMSDVRPIFLYHKLSEDFVTQGGDVRIFALQARLKLTDNLAFIATKDGWVDFNPDAVLNDESGIADVGVGFKYAFYQDVAAGQIFTGGLRYEIPVGDEDVLQGQGDGVFNPFVSGAVALGPVNVMAATGFRLPISDGDSTFYDLDLHVDTKLGWFYPLVEFNLVHVMDAGNRLPIADEGQDFFNFGASNSEGENMITMAIGARAKLSDSLSLGLAYQFPLDKSEGSRVTDWRVTTDLIYNFTI